MVLAPKSTNTKIHAFFPSSQPNSKTREPSSQPNRGFFSTQIDPQSHSQSSPEGTHSYNELRRLSRLPFISSSQDIDDDDDDFQPSPFSRLQRQRSSEKTKKAKEKAKANAVAPSSSASSSSQPSTSSAKQKTPPKRTRRQPSTPKQSTSRSPVVKKERQATPSEEEQFVFEDLSSMIKKERGVQLPEDDDITLEFDDISDLIKKEKGGVQPKEEEVAFTFDGDDLSSLIKKERTLTQQNEPKDDDTTIKLDDLSSLIKEEKKRPRVQQEQERRDDVDATALLDDIYDRPSSASHTHRRHSPQVFTPTPSPPPAQRRRLASPISLAGPSDPVPARARRPSLIQHQPRRSPPRFPGPDVRPQVPRSRRQQDTSQQQQQLSTLDTLLIPRSTRNTRPHERGSQETTPCPLCQQDFPIDTIEAHASDCKGLVTSAATSSSMASTSASAPEECPVCGKYIPVAELERHVNEELEANEQAAAFEAGPSGTSYSSFHSSIPDMSHIYNSSNTNEDASGIESDSDCSLLDLTAEQSQTHSVADPGFPTPSASADEPETVELFSDGEDEGVGEGEGDATGTVDGFESILGQRENPDLQVYFNQLDPDRRNARSTRGRGNSTGRGGSSSRSSNASRSSGNGSGRGSSSRYDSYGRPKWYFKKKKSARGSRSTGGSKSSKSKGGKSRGKGK